MSRRNLVTVSGLQTAPAGRFGEMASFGRTSHSSGMEDDDSSAAMGERILTTKTQKELAEENAMLRRLLDRERKKNNPDGETNDDVICSKPFSISFQTDEENGLDSCTSPGSRQREEKVENEDDGIVDA